MLDPRNSATSTARRASWFLCALMPTILLSIGCAGARDAHPPPNGFSAEGLKGITLALEAAVEREEVGGVVTLVYRRGVVAQVDAVGWQDPQKEKAMARDSIFRIASMSKPIAAVATLILIDEGKIGLDDSVDPWLPELATPNVLDHPTDPLDSGHPAARSISVRDLLTHRAGIATPRTPAGPLREALMEADENNHVGYDRWLARVGELPLAHEPGSTYIYGNSFDVLGILVERVSGIPYPDFLQQRLFAPLGMPDTAFRVPPEKQERFAELQSLGRVPASWIPSSESVPPFPAGAGGLYSTVDDYLQFARMLLGRGEVDGVRILSERAIKDMTTNYLTAEQKARDPFLSAKNFWEGQGFGLGVAIKEEAGVMTTELGRAEVGAFAWPGVFGTWWSADPSRDLIIIYMVPGGDAKPGRWAFQEAVYQAMTD